MAMVESAGSVAVVGAGIIGWRSKYSTDKNLYCERLSSHQCPTGRVFQYQVGSGRVWDKLPGSGSGSGREGVLKYTIRYFWVSILILGIPGYFRDFQGRLDIICWR